MKVWNYWILRQILQRHGFNNRFSITPFLCSTFFVAWKIDFLATRSTVFLRVEPSPKIIQGNHKLPYKSQKARSFLKSFWKKQRFYSDLSHWMFRLGFCRTNELKAWLTTQETNLFRFQLRQLTQKARNEVYQGLLSH